MSETIRKYIGKSGNDLNVTAVVGPQGGRFEIILGFDTSKNGYETFRMSEQQVKDLILTLLRRLNCEEGFTATGYCSDLKEINYAGEDVAE